jgi:hypothetical protein
VTERGIIVLGLPRSGTTLLRRLLDAHPHIACPGETCLFTACARFLRSEIVGDGVPFGVLTGLGFAGFKEAEILDRLRQFAFDFHRDHAKREGKPRWAEKSAIDSFYVDEIEKLCGDEVHYIVITRHGLDAACSNLELSDLGFVFLSEFHDYVRRYPRPLEAFAHAWVDVNRSLLALEERRPAQVTRIRYEDLVVDVDRVMSHIMFKVGETWDPSYVQSGLDKISVGFGDWKTYGSKEVHSESVGRHHALPPYTRNRLGDICNPMLDALGYLEVEYNERADQDPVRRYERGLKLQAGGD